MDFRQLVESALCQSVEIGGESAALLHHAQRLARRGPWRRIGQFDAWARLAPGGRLLVAVRPGGLFEQLAELDSGLLPLAELSSWSLTHRLKAAGIGISPQGCGRVAGARAVVLTDAALAGFAEASPKHAASETTAPLKDLVAKVTV